MPEIRERLQRKNFNKPDDVRNLDKGKVEFLIVAGFTVARATFEPGWRWSTCLEQIACPTFRTAHFGYQVSGTMTTRTMAGIEATSKAGDVVNLPAGHDAWVVGDQSVVFLDFQGMLDYSDPN